jgi:hypothetical protein
LATALAMWAARFGLIRVGLGLALMTKSVIRFRQRQASARIHVMLGFRKARTHIVLPSVQNSCGRLQFNAVHTIYFSPDILRDRVPAGSAIAHLPQPDTRRLHVAQAGLFETLPYWHSSRSELANTCPWPSGVLTSETAMDRARRKVSRGDLKDVGRSTSLLFLDVGCCDDPLQNAIAHHGLTRHH